MGSSGGGCRRWPGTAAERWLAGVVGERWSGTAKLNWRGLGAPVGHCGALAIPDWGSKAARAADDGGQGRRRRTDEVG
jgi:hypothetical protein